MHSYLTRIELQNPLLFDYTTLHQEMGKVGFKRTIQANTGIEYHLPNAEYVISTISSINDVLVTAKRCASLTKKISTVFVVEFTQWTSDGLFPVKK